MTKSRLRSDKLFGEEIKEEIAIFGKEIFEDESYTWGKNN